MELSKEENVKHVASSDSSESRNGADTSEDQENGEPLTAATTIDDKLSVDQAVAEIGDVITTEKHQDTTLQASAMDSEPTTSRESNAPYLPRVTFDDQFDVDNLSDTDAPMPSYMDSSYRSMEERIRKAPKHVSVIVQYTKLMEERVQALEEEVKALKTQKDTASKISTGILDSVGLPAEVSTSTSSNDTDTTSVPMYIPEVKRLSWSNYGERRTHSIEVIYGDPDDISNKETHNMTSKKNENHEKMHTLAAVSPIPGRDNRPTIVRIQSALLRQELRKITDFEFMLDSREVLPPFKPFVAFEEKIRAHVVVLEERLAELKQKETKLLEELASEMEKASAESSGETDIGTASLLVPTTPKGMISAVKLSKPPIFPSQPFSEKDLPIIESCSPQDIGLFMIRTKASLEDAILYTEAHGSYLPAYTAYIEISSLSTEEKEELSRRHEIFEVYTLLEEWKAMIDLLDQDLAETFKVREQIKLKELKTIQFEDLSHLFETGQMVLESEGKNLQVLRVFSSTGGRRIYDDGLLGDVVPENQEEAFATAIVNHFHVASKFSPFVVDCYYLDFNGHHFGPVQKTIPINRYSGDVPLTALPLRPAWFSKEPNNLQQSLESSSQTEDKEDAGCHSTNDSTILGGETKDPWTTLLARGKKFVELCDPNTVVHRQYCGLSFDDPPEEVDSKVIIDFKMATLVTFEDQPRGVGWVPKVGLDGASKADERELKGPGVGSSKVCSIPNCSLCVTSKLPSPILNDQKISQQQTRDFMMKYPLLRERLVYTDQKLEDDDYRLMQYRVFGFILRSRKWARLNVENVEHINHGENNFEKLVLPKGYRNIVQALVETHTKTIDSSKQTKKEKSHEVDLVRGKGKGLIILLHGAPGVGKTSTAECVADHTRRPLFPITCGDIGDNAKDVERNLEWCFQLAHKWGCVLLLDEADVFLAERSKTDLQRNALVSVFLRVLEYYAGILFLTTNRVGTFDEAFKSRIHMSLGYPPLSEKQTNKIWGMNLERTEQAKDLDLEIDRVRILRYSKAHWERAQEENGGSPWNGRQIRNAFQTAIALAKWDFEKKRESDRAKDSDQKKVLKAVLDDSHFEKVAKASRQFDNYLTNVYGGATEADRALEKQRRFDEPGLERIKSFAATPAKFGSSKSTSSRKAARDAEVERTPVKKKKNKKLVSEEDESELEEKALNKEESSSEESD